MLDSWAQALPIVAAAVFTPFAMRWLGSLSPPRHVSESRRRTLSRRHLWIDVVSFPLMFLAAISPLALLKEVPSNDLRGLWALGLIFGLIVIVPFLAICLLTLPFGLWRFKEYWLYYEATYGVGVQGVAWLCIPFAMPGIVSAAQLWIAFGEA